MAPAEKGIGGAGTGGGDVIASEEEHVDAAVAVAAADGASGHAPVAGGGGACEGLVWADPGPPPCQRKKYDIAAVLGCRVGSMAPFDLWRRNQPGCGRIVGLSAPLKAVPSVR